MDFYVPPDQIFLIHTICHIQEISFEPSVFALAQINFPIKFTITHNHGYGLHCISWAIQHSYKLLRIRIWSNSFHYYMLLVSMHRP